MTDEGGEVRPTSGENTGSNMAVASAGERHFQTPRAMNARVPGPEFQHFNYNACLKNSRTLKCFAGQPFNFQLLELKGRPRVSEFDAQPNGLCVKTTLRVGNLFPFR